MFVPCLRCDGDRTPQDRSRSRTDPAAPFCIVPEIPVALKPVGLSLLRQRQDFWARGRNWWIHSRNRGDRPEGSLRGAPGRIAAIAARKRENDDARDNGETGTGA